MQVDVLVAEIGSTTTVLSAFGGLAEWPATEPRLLGQGTAVTSVTEGDVRVGLDLARERLEAVTGALEPALTLATSSAAGGLRMTVHGLTQKMTAMAAREAALGAGGVVEYQTSGTLRDSDLTRIEEVRPGLILLAGGVEGGDSETVLYNAERLLGLTTRPIIVYGGNSAVAGEARELLERAGFRVRVTANVYPDVDELDIVPARHVIHDAFEEHITHAPGMERIADFVTGRILPTPGAVLLAAEALAEAVCDLVVVDVGGATSDVHSVTDGAPDIAAIATDPEPHSKRTVEGDLGTFVSALHVVALLDAEEVPEHLPAAVPEGEEAIEAARTLARTAAVTAVQRHAGRLVHHYTPSGRQTVARGRDLTACRLVIGTGGALTRLPGGVETLEATRAPAGVTGRLLPPADALCLLDREYTMACCGALLAHFPAGAAIALMRRSIGIDEPIA
ncbi:MAG: glutamate mutase L [Coriobacteriia bacterium]|nr:glutamate mutase L [Coriobacteriia bacterium]